MLGWRNSRRLARRRGAVLTTVAALVVAALTAAPAHPEVPPATGNNAVINVQVGGDRQTNELVGPLAGVTLELRTYNGTTTPGPPVGTLWSTCVSDQQGDCSFVVPNTQVGGANRDARFWVTQVSAPTGWYTNPTLRVGSATAAESAPADYRFLTGAQLRAGNTYHSGTNFMNVLGATGVASRQSSGGVWQQSRVDPGIPHKCGIDVALILDLSGSVGDQITDLRNAGNAFVDALVGTPSRMSVFSFSWGSPAQTASQNHPGLQPVSDSAGADVVKGWIADGTPGGGTNWDRGIAAAASANAPRPAADRYDLAIVLTDGNPTNWGGTGTTAATVNGNGSNNRIIEVEKAIFSANELKAQGTRVVAFGVGAGVTDANTAHNLRAISGRTAFDGTNATTADYFQEPSFAAAADALRQIAAATCAGTLSVVKLIVPPGNTGEDVSGAFPAPEGWTFDATTTASPPVPVTPPTATTTDDGTGGVNFDLDFSGGASSADVTVTETQHPGHTLVTQDGDNAVCTDLGTGARLDVANVGGPTDSNPGFTVTAQGPPSQQAISCRVYDREPVPPADVTVDKQWVVHVGGTQHTYADGEQPDFLQAQLMLTSPVSRSPHEWFWGETRYGYQQGDTPTIDERVEVNRPACHFVSGTVTRANGTAVTEELPFTPTLGAGSNHYEITNAVRCTTRLTLRKVVHNRGTGSAAPHDWTLTADGPTPVSGPGNSDAVTDQTIDDGDYTLAESDGPSGFQSDGWHCTGTEQTGPASISAELGQDITCTVENVARAGPRPERSRPVVRTVSSHGRVTPGRPFHDRIHVRRLAGGHGATAVARLYGPFGSRAAVTCDPGSRVRAQTLRVHNGWNRTRPVTLARPGVYTWRVRIRANAANRSATHRCGQAAETTVVAKRPFKPPVVNGGFSGTVLSADRARRAPAGVTIRMPAIGLHAPVRRERIVGGRMTLPDDVSEVGWLRRSAGFGDKIGTAVVGGHVSDRHDVPGALYHLSRAHAGQRITVVRGGRHDRFVVTGKATYDRRHRLPHRYFKTTGRHRLVLISCTAKVVYPNGHFHYTRYVVVVAKPAHRRR